MKTKKNKKYKIGGQLSNCLHHPVTDRKQHTITEDQKLDESILKQIQDIDISKINILHIMIGGTCTKDIHKDFIKYYEDCKKSKSIARSYTSNSLVINIDPRKTPGRNPDKYIHLNYFHSTEPDCIYNLHLKELIENILKKKNTIVIIDNHIFEYLSQEDYSNNLQPFAKFYKNQYSILEKNGRFKHKYMPHDHPSPNDEYLNLNSEQKNRMIFSSYIKPHLITNPRLTGSVEGKKFLLEYYFYICKKLNIEKDKLVVFFKSENFKSLKINHSDILRLLIETKLIELKIPFTSFIINSFKPDNIPENDPKFCSI
jgi:hypothetical protein